MSTTSRECKQLNVVIAVVALAISGPMTGSRTSANSTRDWTKQRNAAGRLWIWRTTGSGSIR